MFMLRLSLMQNERWKKNGSIALGVLFWDLGASSLHFMAGDQAKNRVKLLVYGRVGKMDGLYHNIRRR